MQQPAELLRQGRTDEVWRRYCGFLDLDADGFMRIQERLLMEQLQLAVRSKLGRQLMGTDPPRQVQEFRQRVRLTTYADYAPYLDQQREDVLVEKPVAWSHTSGRSGRYKWMPFTARAFAKMGEAALTQLLLATAGGHGDIRLEPNDVFVNNVAARPYFTGYAALSLSELFELRFVPGVEEGEQMSFQERIQTGFQMGLRTGIDVLGSISSVLIKIGEQFAEGARTTRLSPALLHPAVLYRLGRGLLRSRLAGRPMLPKDLWQVKAIVTGGTDTSIYREKLYEYWGVQPLEGYGCTEAGSIMALQSWNGPGLYFLPDVCFLEFVPEDEWVRWREDESYIPETVLLDEVRLGPRYEIVITNFYGGPFLRYRLHDLVRFISMRDVDAGIDLPSMAFAGRDSDIIDLAGFTGLIDEKMVWQSIVDTGIRHEEWAVRKEIMGLHAGLHLYIELQEDLPAGQVAQQIHEALMVLNPFYGDLVELLGVRPLHVTLLSPGTFMRYIRMQQAAGADPAHLKPPHMNAPEPVIERLLTASRAMPDSENEVANGAPAEP
jgi:hypothetical protein